MILGLVHYLEDMLERLVLLPSVLQILKYDTWTGTLPGRHAGEAGIVVPSPADTEL
jgi:hypothetical protein